MGDSLWTTRRLFSELQAVNYLRERAFVRVSLRIGRYDEQGKFALLDRYLVDPGKAVVDRGIPRVRDFPPGASRDREIGCSRRPRLGIFRRAVYDIYRDTLWRDVWTGPTRRIPRMYAAVFQRIPGRWIAQS